MKRFILFLFLILPYITSAQLDSIEKFRLGMPLTIDKALSMLSENDQSVKKVLLTNGDSTYAEVFGATRDSLHISLNIFRNKLVGIHITWASLNISMPYDKYMQQKYDAFAKKILRQNGKGTVSERNYPVKCTCRNCQAATFININSIHSWEQANIYSLLSIRQQTNELAGRCVTQWGINYTIADNSVTHAINEYLKEH